MVKEDIIKISAFSAGWSWYHDLKLKSKLTVECLLGHYPTLSMRDNPSENWSSKNKPWSGFNILRGGTHRSEHYVYWHSPPLARYTSHWISAHLTKHSVVRNCLLCLHLSLQPCPWSLRVKRGKLWDYGNGKWWKCDGWQCDTILMIVFPFKYFRLHQKYLTHCENCIGVGLPGIFGLRWDSVWMCV